MFSLFIYLSSLFALIIELNCLISSKDSFFEFIFLFNPIEYLLRDLDEDFESLFKLLFHFSLYNIL